MIFYVVLTLLWTALVLFATLTPGDQLPDNAFLDIPYLDKFVHTGLFTVQSYLTIKSFQVLKSFYFIQQIKVILGLIICVGLAVFVEFMQQYIPSRSYESGDLFANIIGIFLGIIAFRILNKYYG
ncbi:VanZ family protein [Bacteroidota bacterium]